jgi:membrane associated rhomboid family serine protease
MHYPPLEDWRRYPVTVAIAIGAVAMTARVWFLHASSDHLVMSDEFWHGELWQPLTSSLIHDNPLQNPLHILFNLMCLWVFGTVFERIYGHARFLLLVVFLTYGSSLAEYIFTTGGIGLSGVGYGLFGMLWILNVRDRRFFGTMDQQTVQVLVGWFFLCIALTIATPLKFANFAHGSGAIFGALLGFVVTEKEKRRTFAWASALVLLMAAIVAAASVGRPYLNLDGDVERQKEVRAFHAAQKAERAYDSKRFNEAADYYSKALAIDDTDATYWYNLGLCYLRLGKPKEAVEAFRHAAELQPDDEKYRSTVEQHSKPKRNNP